MDTAAGGQAEFWFTDASGLQISFTWSDSETTPIPGDWRPFQEPKPVFYLDALDFNHFILPAPKRGIRKSWTGWDKVHEKVNPLHIKSRFIDGKRKLAPHRRDMYKR